MATKAGKGYRYPLRMPREESTAVAALVKSTGHSINDVLLLVIRKGLPLAREALRPVERITNVEPLPDHVLARLYRERADDADGIRLLAAAQPFHAE